MAPATGDGVGLKIRIEGLRPSAERSRRDRTGGSSCSGVVRAEAAYALGAAGVSRPDILEALRGLESDSEYGPRGRASQALALLNPDAAS